MKTPTNAGLLLNKRRYIIWMAIACWSLSLSCKRSTHPNIEVVAKQRENLLTVKRLLSEQKFVEAERTASASLKQFPDDRELRFSHGEAVWAMKDLPRAREIFASLEGRDDLGRTSWIYQAEIAKQSSDYYQAVKSLSSGCYSCPKDPRFSLKLGVLLYSLGSTWEAQPYFERVLRQGLAPQDVLTILIDCNKPIKPDDQLLQQALLVHPDDLRPLLIDAIVKSKLENHAEALQISEAILKVHPEFVPAYLLYGQLLAGLRPAQLSQWFAAAPPTCQTYPDYWKACGLWAEQMEAYPIAARCFSEVVALDPNHREALQHLARMLLVLDRREEAARAEQRIKELSAIDIAADQLLTLHPGSQRAALRLAESLAQAGRVWEAVGWSAIALEYKSDLDPKGEAIHQSLTKQLRYDLPLVTDKHRVALWIAYKEFPLPGNQLVELAAVRNEGEQKSLVGSLDDRTARFNQHGIRLNNEAVARGLLFQYDNGNKSQAPATMMHQSNGGGVAVLDYDLDGWPDLYFSQAGGQPLDVNSDTPNRLFKNFAGQFHDITQETRVGSLGFGQGVTSGDFNDDGFPDIVASGIGILELYANNGDGTFSLCDPACGLARPKGWRSSVVIADLNRDGYADIYQAAYIAGEEVFRQRCFDFDDPKRVTVCRPTNFPAGQDAVFFGNGDGTFRDGSEELRNTEPGRGLGLLVVNLDDAPGLELFVANDMSANFLWKFDSTLTETAEESASARGLAMNDYAMAQACMGVAAADVDSDGDLDLVVTNFTDEANCFYRQVRPGIFRDEAFRSGMTDLSFRYLGFGTQFADWDLDGRPELLIANGHVGEDKKYGYQMPMQMLAFDQPTQRWYELNRELIGEYPASPHIGRALAILDVDRDFLPDAALSLLDEPAALLINTSETVGHAIRLRLVARFGHRDAIGAKVTVWAGEQKQMFQRIAGDGFHCANEAAITIGMGDNKQADKLEIQWPSGRHQELLNVMTDHEYVVVEIK